MDKNEESYIAPSLDEIEKGLFLGNAAAASDLDTLTEHKITYILTIDSCPIPSFITQIQRLTTKYFQIADVEDEDILGRLTECIEFIELAKQNKSNILVHCYFGVSRSSAIVISYIMKKYKIPYNVAYLRVKEKRRFAYPNKGFVKQLILFYHMGWKIDIKNVHYKNYRLRLAANQVRKIQILPQNFMDLIKLDPSITQEYPDPITYRCKKCRRIIANKTNFITHRKKNQQQLLQHPNSLNSSISQMEICDDNNLFATHNNNNNDLPNSDPNVNYASNNNNNNNNNGFTNGNNKSSDDIEICREIYFIEPLAWMVGVTKQTQGKLHCPKCSNKLGNFSWINGCNCPCGKLVSPAFYLVPSKVELSHAVQNVQITV